MSALMATRDDTSSPAVFAHCVPRSDVHPSLTHLFRSKGSKKRFLHTVRRAVDEFISATRHVKHHHSLVRSINAICEKGTMITASLAKLLCNFSRRDISRRNDVLRSGKLGLDTMHHITWPGCASSQFVALRFSCGRCKLAL
jgi:hypothetical protein